MSFGGCRLMPRTGAHLGNVGLDYPAIETADCAPISAMHDYEIRMTRDEMPPETVFWSATLYDLKNGLFIPNDRKKYSVGENGRMKLDADGGLNIRIAGERPDDVPGVGHCSGGVGPDWVNYLEIMDYWVETGAAPDELPAYWREAAGQGTGSRLICAYPQVAEYDGQCDPRDVSSFSFVSRD